MENDNDSWVLYVLRYDRTGNYYVGAAPDLEKRLSKHLNKSKNKVRSIASLSNESWQGFDYFKYDIKKNEEIKATQSNSNKIENQLTQFVKKYMEENEPNVIVNGGNVAKPTEAQMTKIEELKRNNPGLVTPMTQETKSFLRNLQTNSQEIFKYCYKGKVKNQSKKEQKCVEIIEYSEEGHKDPLYTEN